MNDALNPTRAIASMAITIVLGGTPMRHFTIAALTAIGLLAAAPALAQTPAPATGSNTSTMQKAPKAPPVIDGVQKAPAKAATTSAAKHTELMDINSATEAQLSTLPGIAKARSEAIIKGRPYKGKDELVSKKIIPQNVYNEIKDKIIAKQKG